MQSCPGSGSQSQEQRAGRQRQQIIAKCIASTVGPSRRKVWSQRQGQAILSVLHPDSSPPRLGRAASLWAPAPLLHGKGTPAASRRGCSWFLSSGACSLASVEGLQKEKFRGGNVTAEGNHRLLLGGKQADGLGNFCAV